MIFDKLFYLIFPIIFFQTIFAPGIILLSKLKLKINFFSYLTFAFISSFLLNYIVVYLLLFLNIFNIYTAWFYVILNFLIIFLNYKNILNYIFDTVKIFKIEISKIYISDKFIFYVCFASLFFLLSIFLQNFLNEIKHSTFGYLRIFEMQDVVQNYDRWSKDYARGIIPDTSYVRPHLLSVNFSLIYVLSGSIYFEFIPLLILSLLPFFFFFIGISFAINLKNLIFIPVSLYAVNILFTKTFGQAFSGYLEVPMSLFIMALMLSIYEFCKKGETKYLIILFITYISALLIKEWNWLVLLILGLYFLISPSFFNYKINRKYKFYFIFLTLIIVAPFYIYQFFQHELLNNILFLLKQLTFDNDMHTSAGHNQELLNIKTRIPYALGMFSQILVIPIIGLFFQSFKDKILNLFSIAYLSQILFWILFSPQEDRYLYALYFFFIFFGITNLVSLIYSKIKKYYNQISLKHILSTIFILWILFIALYNKTISKKEIEFKIFEKKVNLHFDKNLDKEINHYYYRYLLNKDNLKNKILTNYRYFYVKNIPIFSDVFEYDKDLNIENLNFKYYLIYKKCNLEKIQKLNFNIKLIKFFDNKTCFIKIEN